MLPSNDDHRPFTVILPIVNFCALTPLQIVHKSTTKRNLDCAPQKRKSGLDVIKSIPCSPGHNLNAPQKVQTSKHSILNMLAFLVLCFFLVFEKGKTFPAPGPERLKATQSLSFAKCNQTINRFAPLGENCF